MIASAARHANRAAYSDGLDRPPRLRRLWWRHPELPWLAPAAGAWLYLLTSHLVDHDAVDGPWRFAPLDWALMVVAMMIPASLPMVRVIGLDSMWNRRLRSPGLFVATTVAIWTLLGVGVAAAIAAAEWLTGLRFDPGPRWVAAALLVAAGWQFAPGKVRSLRRGHLRTPLAPRGWKADRSAVRLGLVHGRACLAGCGPMMAAMFLAGHDHVHLMLPLTVVAVAERRRPRSDPRPGGLALLVLTVLWPLL